METTYLVLLSEGGIVQFEEVFSNENDAMARHDEWESDEDTDNDAYVYRLITSPRGLLIHRGQGGLGNVSWFGI